MRVVVEYTVPVRAVVETETGEVVEVGVSEHYLKPVGNFFDDKVSPFPRTRTLATRRCG